MTDYKNFKAKQSKCRVCFDIIFASIIFSGFVVVTWTAMAIF
jgi:hypothetical protein